jgi:hypothetical protein
MTAEANDSPELAHQPQSSPILARFLTRRLVSRLYTAAVIAFILALLLKDREAVSAALLSASSLPLVLAVIVNTIALLVQGQTWAIIQRATVNSSSAASPTTHRDFWGWTHFFLVGYLGRYVPGKVSMLVGRVLLLEPLGYSKSSIISAAIFENLSFLTAGIAVGFVGLASISPTMLGSVVGSPFLLAVILIAGVGVILSPLPEEFLRRAILLVKPKSTASLVTISPSTKLSAVSLSVVSNLLLGLSYALILSAIASTDLSLHEMALATAVFPLAVAGGVLALFAPSGIGVREAIIAALLAPAIDLELALLAAILIRVLMCLVEVSLFLVAKALSRRF